MILDFYWRVWQRSGLIHNAQAIGYPGIFHRHENDETEITGYLVVQAFDYYRKTRDTAFLREIMPMLEWATEAQQRNLIDGMLPFNGDETYIAGGVVPRQVMYHGSAEATLLFVEGSRRLIRFVREQGLWSAAGSEPWSATRTNAASGSAIISAATGICTLTIPGGNGKSLIRRPGPASACIPGISTIFPRRTISRDASIFAKIA